VKLSRKPSSAARGIGTVLAVLLLVALVPAFSLQMLLHFRRFQAEYRDELQVNLELAYSVGSTLEAHLDMAAVQAGALGETLASMRPFTAERANAYLAENIGRYPALLQLHWATPEGRVIASSDPRAAGGLVADRDFFRRALQRRGWILSDLIPNDSGGQPLVLLAQAVYGRNRMQGVLIASVYPRMLTPHRLDTSVEATDWMVIDRRGKLAFSQPEPSGWMWRQRDLYGDPLVAAALRGEAASGRARSPVTGEDRLVAWVPIGTLGWVAGVGRSENLVLSPLWRDLALSVLFSLAVALLSGLLALRLGRRVVLDIGRLKDSVAALGRGQVPSEPVPVGSLVELQSLAGSFHRMAVHRAAVEESLQRSEARLREFNLQLEQRVQMRTAEVRQQAHQLRALALKLTRTEQRERRRLAGILHDHVQQLLVSVRMQLGVLQREPLSAAGRQAAALSDRLIGECIQDCRSLTVELSPPVLYNAGLVAAFEWMARRLAEQYQFIVDLDTDPRAVPQSQDLCDFLFQAVRELLFNAVKHSGVDRARVSLRRENGNAAMVVVEDSGKGLEPKAIQPESLPAGKFGLFSIRQRLEHLGGRMEVSGAPGQGTRVTLWMPLQSGEETEEASSGADDEPSGGETVVHGRSPGTMDSPAHPG
jgi:signal transduction histidine kinase